MKLPLVSVICLCYNHSRFLKEAIDSVLAQSYPNIEIIIVDDASTDDSAELLKDYTRQYPQITFVGHTQNKGNCAAFNEGLWKSKGEYILDFATDDVLLPERIAQQVQCFEQAGPNVGVVYTDALMIDEASKSLHQFYRRTAGGELLPKPVSGDVFADVLSRYFICSPTMMIRRQVMEELGGYDPNLAYEDFDFWVRSARKWKYQYLDQVTTKRRLHPHAMSKGWYKVGDPQLQSTIEVCRKALNMLRDEREKQALRVRLHYELRQAVFSGNFPEANQLYKLITETGGASAAYQLLGWMGHQRINLSFLRRWYYRWRYKQ